ncbi:hypothetical protein [Stutzerimonas nitrititolerans]|uniref:Uncharacterized protein n=1 Tax=Stutzerimonas nitrititolerans TaxID=2482751 RepID=A0ABX9USK9_9GAMM|nr:hypothetical protein [Stutzerimonas nitrititolerans]RMH95924.1 hypothetical protein EA795_20645 [Stutzerimonas nitrititolerans]
MSNEIKRLRKRKVEELAQLAMTGLVMSGKHSISQYTAANAYDLAEAMMDEHEKRFGPLSQADL